MLNILIGNLDNIKGDNSLNSNLLKLLRKSVGKFFNILDDKLNKILNGNLANTVGFNLGVIIANLDNDNLLKVLIDNLDSISVLNLYMVFDKISSDVVFNISKRLDSEIFLILLEFII